MTHQPPVAEHIPSEQTIIELTRQWLAKAVIGLNLCPFAKHPWAQDRIRFVVSQAVTAADLLTELSTELKQLQATDPTVCETTLLIHPQVLNDFLTYNDFLDDCDGALTALQLDGELQIASFHPDYQFADAEPDDMANCSNRSPFPMLHLLREASITRALAGEFNVDDLIETNQRTLRELGHAGWQRLFAH